VKRIVVDGSTIVKLPTLLHGVAASAADAHGSFISLYIYSDRSRCTEASMKSRQHALDNLPLKASSAAHDCIIGLRTIVVIVIPIKTRPRTTGVFTKQNVFTHLL